MRFAHTYSPPPSGGAATHEILIAAGMAAVVLGIDAWIIWGERFGKPTVVSRLADWSAGLLKLPRWLVLPAALGIVSIAAAGFGVWWDVPTHMQVGRDPGPLANPSHYPIFFGILGFFSSGLWSMAFARDPLPRHTVKIWKDWRVPFGSLPITAAGLVALLGFPADDLWHRLFGQDVTEWGATHTMMIGGAVTFVLGYPLLLAEAAQTASPRTRGWVGKFLGAFAIAGCGIPFAFLMEFDLGVPQFPASMQFLLFAFLVTWIACAVRIWFGPGGAILTAVLFLGAHALLFASVWLIPGVLTGRFLLMIPSAIIIELVAAVVRPRTTGRHLTFGVVSGLLVGSLGMYAEWWWSKWFMPLPQPFSAHVLPFLLAVSTVAGVAGGFIATWMLARLRVIGSKTAPTGPMPRRFIGLAGMLTFVALMAAFAPPSSGTPYTGTVTYSGVSGAAAGAPECPTDNENVCTAYVTLTFDGTDPVPDAAWFYALAWQGHPKGTPVTGPLDPVSSVPGLVRSKMIATGTPGQYRSEHPLPLYGKWKTLLRLHTIPREMVAFPIYAPDDPAISSSTGREVHVSNGAKLTTTLEQTFLQREKRDDVPQWLWLAGTLLVVAMWIGVLMFYGWCFNRAAKPLASGTPTPIPTGGK